MRLTASAHPVRWGVVAAIGFGVVIVSAAGVRAPLPWDSAPAQRPAPDPRRNVVLIILDTVRHDDLFASAPRVSSFASGTIRFDSAWSPGAWTVPSHFAMLTGRDPWTVPFDARNDRYRYDGEWLATALRRRGYETGAIFANYRLTAYEGYGRDFDHLVRSRASGVCRSGIGFLIATATRHMNRHPLLCAKLAAPEVAARARDFLRRSRRPYFLALNFMDAHDPYIVLDECRERGLRILTHPERRSVHRASPARPADPKTAAAMRTQYRAAIRCMDRTLGPLLEELDDGQTVIAIVSDHGEQFGEHDVGGHGTSVYRQVLQVPLLLRIPGMPARRVIDAVSTTDLYQSLLRASDPSRARAPVPLLDPGQRRPAISHFSASGRGEAFSIVRENLHLIRDREGRELWFDLVADPDERRPLPVPPDAARVQAMREALRAASRNQQQGEAFHALGYLR
jgi:arylsulfatase A-like enzyme